jgi:hypothetical protein
MPRSTNPFVSRVYFWWLIAPVLSAMLFPAFLTVQQLQISQHEADFAEETRQDVVEVNQTAAGCFNDWFVTNGILARTMSDSSRADASGAVEASWIVGTLHAWFVKFWLFTYRCMWRWIAFWPLYVSGILGIALPCLVDGMVARSKKRYDFGQYNPLAFGVSGRFFAILIGWLFYVPMLPLPLTGALMASLFCAFGLFAWLTTANFQRGR